MTPTTNTNSPANETTILLPTDSRGRIKLPKERREALLEEFERSGMSGQEFAKWAGVKYPTFAYWRQQRRKKLGIGQEKPLLVNLVEAVMEEPQSKEAVGVSLMIHVPGGLRVECAGAEQAAEFVRAMGGRSC